MAFQEVKELHEGRSGGLREGLERQYVRKFRVRTDTKLVGPIEVTFAPGIPRLYDPYQSFGTGEFDTFALCRDIDPQQDEGDWTLWYVTCRYDTSGGTPYGQPSSPGQPGSGGGSGAAGDPTLEPPTVEWGVQTREVAFMEDLGNPDEDINPDYLIPRALLNSAGQPFDPVPTIEMCHLTLTIERNEAAFDQLKARKYKNVVNKDAWGVEGQNYAAGLWLLKHITGRAVYKGAFKYARVRYEFWLAPTVDEKDHWDNLDLLDQGLCRKGETGGPPRPIIVNGHPITQPALLDGVGVPLTPAQIADPAVGPQFLRFKRYRREPFAPLNITL